MAKKKIVCIYKIVNIKNDKYYLGSSEDFNKRVKRHLKDLRMKRHHNIYLQRAYEKYGEDSFKFEIIKKCSKTQRVKLEQAYLDKRDKKQCYNVSGSASGGDLIQNHPNRKQIIEKVTQILVDNNRTQESRERNRNQIGDKNPNFGKRWSKALKKKASKITKERWKRLSKEAKESHKIKAGENSRKMWDSERGMKMRKEKSNLMKGKNNPFYGKKHSKRVLKIISEKNKGKSGSHRWKAVVIEGTVYKSATEAAKILKMDISTLWYRCKSTNPKFQEWNFDGIIKVFQPIKFPHTQKYKYQEQIFDSVTEAAKFFNKSITAMLFRARSKDPKWKDYSLIG